MSLARLTNGLSKGRNHPHSMALFTTYYNFVPVHRRYALNPGDSRRHVVSTFGADIVALLEAAEPKPSERGPYGKLGPVKSRLRNVDK
jgi:hypothetical protein